MLKKALFVLPLFIIALTIFSFTIEKRKAVKTIIIDPGHGGIDQGADGLFSTEAQVALSISKKIGEAMAKDLPEVKVLFTRTTDVLPGNCRNKSEALRYRANFANNSKADLFISIHCNSAGRSAGGWNDKRVIGYDEKITYAGKKKKKQITKVPIWETYYVKNESKGTETFVWTEKENSHKQQLVGNNAEFTAGEEDSSITVQEDDPVINALKFLYTKKYFLNSLHLAELVQQEFTKTGRINRGVKQRNDVGIWVLHATGMPSILVETGFISNKEEEEYINSEAGQIEMVKNITDAVKQYIALLENPKKNQDSGMIVPPKNAAAILHQKRWKLVTA